MSSCLPASVGPRWPIARSAASARSAGGCRSPTSTCGRNAGKFANSIKEGLEAQIGNPTPGQQILIKLVAIKVLRCEMMYDQVLSNPRGGDLQNRVENYFLAWSNSIRRDLEALGVLDTPSDGDPLIIDPADMTNEQLDAALALIERRQPAGATTLSRSSSRHLHQATRQTPGCDRVCRYTSQTPCSILINLNPVSSTGESAVSELVSDRRARLRLTRGSAA